MSKGLVIRENQLDLKDLQIDFPQKDKSMNYHRSDVLYNSTPLLMQSPPLTLTNVQDGLLELALTKESQDFYKLVSTLEHHTMRYITAKSGEWFSRAIPLDKIRSMFRSCLFSPETMELPFQIRLRLARNVKVFKSNGEPTDLTAIKINKKITCVFKVNGLLFGKNTTKLDLKVAQIGVVEEPKKIPEPPTEPDGEADYDSDMDDTVFNPPIKQIKQINLAVKPPVQKEEPIQEEPVQEPIQEEEKPEEKPEEKSEEEPVQEPVQEPVHEEPPKKVEKIEKPKKVKDAYEKRLTKLRNDMQEFSDKGDYQKVEEIACEIIELRKSMTIRET